MTFEEFKKNFESGSPVRCRNITERNHLLQCLKDMGYPFGHNTARYLADDAENSMYLHPMYNIADKRVCCSFSAHRDSMRYDDVIDLLDDTMPEEIDDSAFESCAFECV